MSIPSRAAAQAPVQNRSTNRTPAESGDKQPQLKKDLRGMSFEAGEAYLAPRQGNKSGGAGSPAGSVQRLAAPGGEAKDQGPQPGKTEGPKAIPVATADESFNAWVAEHDRLVKEGKRPPAPSEEAKWNWALDKIKERIKPCVLPEGYQPPPVRSKAKPAPAKGDANGAAQTNQGGADADKKAAGAAQGGSGAATDYDTYRKNSERGQRILHDTLRGLELFPELSPQDAYKYYLEFSKGRKCNKDPKQDEKEIREFRAKLGLDKPAGPVVSQAEPGEMKRIKARAAEREQILKDLDWARTSPIGSGFYGISRAAGAGHSEAMVKAKVVQMAFDAAGNHASGKQNGAGEPSVPGT